MKRMLISRELPYPCDGMMVNMFNETVRVAEEKPNLDILLAMPDNKRRERCLLIDWQRSSLSSSEVVVVKDELIRECH